MFIFCFIYFFISSFFVSRFSALNWTGLWLDLAAKPDTALHAACLLAVELRHFVVLSWVFQRHRLRFFLSTPVVLFIFWGHHFCAVDNFNLQLQWVVVVFWLRPFLVSERVARGEPVRRRPGVGHMRRSAGAGVVQRAVGWRVELKSVKPHCWPITDVLCETLPDCQRGLGVSGKGRTKFWRVAQRFLDEVVSSFKLYVVLRFRSDEPFQCTNQHNYV